MKIFRLANPCAAILFDMDSTLYTHDEYARLQNDLPIGRLAQVRGTSFGQMRDEVSSFKENWAKEHGGQQISLANTFAAFDIPIEESVRWREELYRPEQYLGEDRRLRSTLEKLARRFALSVVTNNPVSIAARTLGALGIGDLFCAIVGLDTCGVSKPHREPFLRAASLSGAAPESCVSVGDRYDIDIALPLELGMGGILVSGVEDVYTLMDVFTHSARSPKASF